jgi:hypothetical protein
MENVSVNDLGVGTRVLTRFAPNGVATMESATKRQQHAYATKDSQERTVLKSSAQRTAILMGNAIWRLASVFVRPAGQARPAAFGYVRRTVVGMVYAKQMESASVSMDTMVWPVSTGPALNHAPIMESATMKQEFALASQVITKTIALLGSARMTAMGMVHAMRPQESVSASLGLRVLGVS